MQQDATDNVANSYILSPDQVGLNIYGVQIGVHVLHTQAGGAQHSGPEPKAGNFVTGFL